MVPITTLESGIEGAWVRHLLRELSIAMYNISAIDGWSYEDMLEMSDFVVWLQILSSEL